LVENLPRVLPEGVRARLDARTWPLLPVFSWLAETGSIDRAEMASTFNLGIGLVLVVAEDSADAVVAALGEPVFTIGRIEAGAGAPVVRLDHLETAWAGAASPS
jgi:phosphoribosylformylglycinamidine cyclo-ligase